MLIARFPALGYQAFRGQPFCIMGGQVGDIWDYAKRHSDPVADIEHRDTHWFILDVHHGQRCVWSEAFQTLTEAYARLQQFCQDDFARLLAAPRKLNGSAEVKMK
ncbi:MAG: hypothetical protein ACREEW_14465 [Caulobacteraceae bacterium]